MKLQAITITTLVIAVTALPTPEGSNLNMKRQLGSGNNKEEGAPWKRADVSNKNTITLRGCWSWYTYYGSIGSYRPRFCKSSLCLSYIPRVVLLNDGLFLEKARKERGRKPRLSLTKQISESHSANQRLACWIQKVRYACLWAPHWESVC